MDKESYLNSKDKYISTVSLEYRKLKALKDGKDFIPKKSHTLSEEHRKQCSIRSKERCNKEGYVYNTVEKVSCFNLETKVYEQVDKEEFNKYKNIKYCGVTSKLTKPDYVSKLVKGFVTCFNLETLQFEKISKEEFNKYKNIKYCGTTSRLVIEYKNR